MKRGREIILTQPGRYEVLVRDQMHNQYVWTLQDGDAEIVGVFTDFDKALRVIHKRWKGSAEWKERVITSLMSDAQYSEDSRREIAKVLRGEAYDMTHLIDIEEFGDMTLRRFVVNQ